MIILATTIIISLNNNGIIKNANQAVDLTNEAQVKILAQTLWAEEYLNGIRTQEELMLGVNKKLKAQRNNKGRLFSRCNNNWSRSNRCGYMGSCIYMY